MAEILSLIRSRLIVPLLPIKVDTRLLIPSSKAIHDTEKYSFL
jgi:hypothetical protein